MSAAPQPVPHTHHASHGHASHDHAHHHHAPVRPETGRPSALRVENLTVTWRGHPAVHHLSGGFAAGRLSAVIGPNGAGKSSLLTTLAGARAPTSGRVLREAGLRLAYLPQTAELDRQFPVRVEEFVAMGLWARIGSFGGVGRAQRQQVRDALATLGLAGFEHRLLGELSAGQVQRVLFARVIVQDAALILLDEPFNAIDARTTADLLAQLHQWRDQGRTVIAVLHDMEQVRQHFDHALLLAREAIAWGPVAEVLSPEHLLAARHMAEAWDESARLCEQDRAAHEARPAGAAR